MLAITPKPPASSVLRANDLKPGLEIPQSKNSGLKRLDFVPLNEVNLCPIRVISRSFCRQYLLIGCGVFPRDVNQQDTR